MMTTSRSGFSPPTGDDLSSPPLHQNNSTTFDADLEHVKRNLVLEIGLGDLIGETPAFRKVVEEIKILAASDATVLISGETGTGKDLCARAIHYSGRRAAKPFVAINCGGVPDDLFENQFFGHERGAYTDARDQSAGLLSEANGGTLYLDDVEALSMKNQVKLLRFLQTGFYIPLGCAREHRTDVRVIAATNDDLVGRLKDRTFRGDLYFRLAVLTLFLPPLRERKGDVGLLARVFLKRFAEQYKKSVGQISDGAVALLSGYSWPGNVRELENTVHRAIVHLKGDVLTEAGLSFEHEEYLASAAVSKAPQSFKERKRELVASFEREYVIQLLRSHGGNVSKAARECGKNRRAFWELMRKYHITAERVPRQ